MHRFLLLAAGVIIAVTGLAQKKVPLINSGELLSAGKELYDSGKYEAAINTFLTIPRRDTNYVSMLSELALTYIADKQPEKALEACAEALQKPSVHRAHLLRSQAIATDHKGDFEKSVALFKKAIEQYPFDYGLVFNLGITYYNHKDYDKAIDCFFNALSINPFHAGSHLNLARISMSQGRKTHAMFSFGVYLCINNLDNERLVLADKFLSNQVAEEGSLPVSGSNGCEKLDQIIRAKIAMDKNFKSMMPLDAPVVRQFEMFFQQLSTINTQADDRWVTHYLPLYKAIQEQQAVESFMYHILASANNDHVRKWRKKNDKALTAFFTIANVAIRKKREVLSVPSSLGFDSPVQAWYTDNNSLEAIGKKGTDDVKHGRWIYYENNQERSAEGSYDDKGVKTGTWKYYHGNGSLKSEGNYQTGEVTLYREDGTKSQHFYLKNEEIDGIAEVYYSCGALKEQLTYRDGKRNGPGKSFFASGKVDVTYQYAMDNATGESLSYFENGQLFSRTLYEDGKMQGPYTEYFFNGKLRATGRYVDDAADGEWKYYHKNGALEKTGSFKEDVSIGTWTVYDKSGLLAEKINYSEKGEWTGENTVYHDGKIQYVYTYKDDVLIGMVYYDKNGKALGKYGSDSGTFAAKTYFPAGQLQSEGNLKAGKYDGVWKYYYRSGKLLSEFTYVDGLVQGDAAEYFQSGARKFTFQYEDNKLHGYFQEFYPHGQVKQEGWFHQGDRLQQWLGYHANGMLESDYYYLNDELQGTCVDYGVDGKVVGSITYENGVICDMQNFDEKGNLLTVKQEKEGRIVYETRYANSKPRTRFETLCGTYFGSVTQWLPDGKPLYVYPLSNGHRNGLYKHFAINSQLEVEGNYVNGSKEGSWKGYHDNSQQDYEGWYYNDEQDSTWTYYFLHGNVSSVGQFKDDQRHGVTTYNNTEGTPLLEKLFDAGDLLAYRVMNPNGQWSEWTSFTGNAIITVQYPNGVKAYEETYQDGAIDGQKRYYFPNGKLYSEYSYRQGDFQGPYTVYYPTGKLREKGEYQYDELNGTSESYHEDGSLHKTENYKLGVRNGKAVLYNKGAVIKEYTFWDGMILH
jgi:antitoxin component YwqK of YwqJK toxin-antitoxin module/Tfp pilus assembly protein PilF